MYSGIRRAEFMWVRSGHLGLHTKSSRWIESEIVSCGQQWKITKIAVSSLMVITQMQKL